MNKKIFKVAFTALLAVTLCGSFALTFAADAEKDGAGEKAETVKTMDPDSPVAVVDGNPILRSEYDREVKMYLAKLSQQAGGHSMDIAGNDELKNEVLNSLVDKELLYQEAKKTAPEDLETKIETEYGNIVARFPDEETFKSEMEKQGMTEKELKLTIRKGLTVDNYIMTSVFPKVEISDEDAKKFYDENEKLFLKPEQVKASHILFGTNPADSEEAKKEARDKAEKVRSEIVAGADFAEKAKEHSTCPSAPKGGDLGFFGKGQMVPPFEEAAYALDVGEVSDVVETRFGYHIIKLDERQDAGKVSFEETKARIVDFLKKQKVSEDLQDLVANLREKAKIDIVAPHL